MKWIPYILLLLLPVFVSGQNMLNGTVTDAESGEILPFASVRWMVSKAGTTSDAQGHFSLAISNADTDTLEISTVGYETVYILYSTANNPTWKMDIANVAVTLRRLSLIIDPVVITATRYEMAAGSIPQKVTLIDSLSIHSLPMLNVDDALIYSSGVMADRPMGIFAAKSVVSMRGLPGGEQGRTLILVDGIPINKSDGGTVNFNLIDPLGVNRIEVVKGPASALYGGNAMGGVINIISTIPDEKLSGRVKLGYSTFNTASGNLYLSGFNGKTKQKGFFWAASAFYRSSDGYVSEPEFEQTEYTVPVFVKEQTYNLTAGYKFSDSRRIRLDMLLYDDERGGGEKVYEELGSYSEHDSYHFRLRYNDLLLGWRISTFAYFLRENYCKVNEYMKSGEYTLYDVDSKRQDIGLIHHMSREVGKFQTLSMGFDLRQGSVDAADIYRTAMDKIINAGVMNMGAVYIQDEVRIIGNKLLLIGGLRFDYAHYHDGQFVIENPSPATLYLLDYQQEQMPENTWHSLSPKLALQYNTKHHNRLYLSYARGFRTPILDDLCRSGKTRGGFQVAHPTLMPESIHSIEMGYRFKLGRKFLAEPTLYYSIGNDFMYSVATGDTVDMGYAAPVLFTANVSRVQIYGFETDFTFKANEHWMMFANYAFAHSVILDYTPETTQLTDISGKFLSNVPEHLVNAGLRFNHRVLGFMINARYVGKRWVNDTNTEDEKYFLPAQYDDYFTFDLRLWKEFMNRWQLGFSLLNATDEIYTDSKGQVCPGRIWQVEVGVRF